MVFTYTTPAKLKMKKENLSSQIDGEKTIFGISQNYEAGSIRVYYNGVRQIVGVTFSELNTTQIQLNFTPATGEFLAVEYIPL